MKTLKIKFGLFSLLAILAVSVFLTSCEQTISSLQTEVNDVVDTSLLSEEELINKLQSDEDAMGLATAMEEFEQIMREALVNNDASVIMLRNHYEAGNEEGLEELFGDTELLAVYERIEYHANRFAQKFPGIEEDLSKFMTYEPTNTDVEHLPFATLEANMEMRGCGCCGANFWGKVACKGLCVLNGTACTVATGGLASYVCAMGGYACTEFCDWYYCDYL